MSVPVVFLDSMLDQEVANRLATIITKHQVTQSEQFRVGFQLMIILVFDQSINYFFLIQRTCFCDQLIYVCSILNIK